MTLNTPPITIVSLGAGDPEQVTLRALKELQAADRIFCPTTFREVPQSSRAVSILTTLGIDSTKIETYFLPMNRERSEAIHSYSQVAEKVIRLYNENLKIVITAEGDGGFYSSSSYISEMLTASAVPVCRVSGVPAFIDCAALANLHVASGDSPLVVLPLLDDTDKATEILSAGSSIVCMKLSGSESKIKTFISENADKATFHYFENRGGEKEFYTTNVETILDRKFPYFSLLIVKSV